MKKLLTFLFILLIIGVALIITKPSDEQCIELIKSKLEARIANSAGNNPLSSFLTFISGKAIDNVKVFIRIEDKTFYKEIYLGEVKLGMAVFGTFVVDRDLQNNINRINNTWDRKIDNLKQTIRSVFHHKQQTHYVGNDLSSLEQELIQAQNDLQKLKRFHLLRSKQKKESEIEQKEQEIQTLEERIRAIKNQN